MRRTFADIKDPTQSRVAQRLQLCPTDPRLAYYVNAYQQRAISRGKWWGTYGRWHVCTQNGCITLPPQIATVERAAVCGQHVPVEDLWFSFLSNGHGTSTGPGCTTCGGNWGCGCPGGARYRGQFPTFDDLIGVNKKIQAVCDLASDVGQEIRFLGYDENNNWIRTIQGGEWKDGELIALSQSSGTLSTKNFTSITDIQIPGDLDGQWWLYEYNVDTTDIRMIGQYQYWETRPSYARYQFPAIGQIQSSNGNGQCNKAIVEIVGKFEFIPVKQDTDYMILGSIPACEEGVLWVKYGEPGGDEEKSMLHMAKTLEELDRELNHYLGDGRRIGINLVGASVGEAQPIKTFL